MSHHGACHFQPLRNVLPQGLTHHTPFNPEIVFPMEVDVVSICDHQAPALQIGAKKREREEHHLFLTAKVVTDNIFARHQGFDLATFDNECGPSSSLPAGFRVLRQEMYKVFKSRVVDHFGLPENKFRLWVLANRQNKTVRPDTYIPENEPTLTLEVIRNNVCASQTDLCLYLDVIPDPSKPDLSAGTIMIFLKYFDMPKQTLYGVGKVYVSRRSRVYHLCSIINERMGWTFGTPLKLYEEVKPGMIVLMEQNATFSKEEIQDGDVICFQVDQPDKEIRDLENQGRYSNPIQFYAFLRNRMTTSSTATVRISIPHGAKKLHFSFEKTKLTPVAAEITLGSPATSEPHTSCTIFVQDAAESD